MSQTVKAVAKAFGVDLRRYNARQSDEARFFFQLANHGVDLVIDVGANDGGYGRALRRGGYTGSILSFEPLTDAHGRLQRLASADSKWYVAPRMALGSEQLEHRINIAGNSRSSSMLSMDRRHVSAAPESRYVGTETVTVCRLDDVDHDVVGRAVVPFLKIDTQGFEMPVLEGATRMLERAVGVQLELSLTRLYEGQVLYEDIIKWLDDRGFCLWNVIPGFVDPTNGRLLQMDGVFFRGSETQ
jgi:FkbM family methyltransferase